MSISPSTDLIMDVARAASPQRAAAATQKLVAITPSGNSENFASLLASGSRTSLGPASSQEPVTSALLEKLNGRHTPVLPASSDPVAKAYQSLGALMLQKSIEGMMPKSDKSLFGTGSAGGIWNAMLAEHIAAKAAASSFQLPERHKTQPASTHTHTPALS